MTLEEAKNEVAKTHGCKYWGDLLQQVHVGKLKGDIETYSDEAAFLYAESKVENLAQPVVISQYCPKCNATLYGENARFGEGCQKCTHSY